MVDVRSIDWESRMVSFAEALDSFISAETTVSGSCRMVDMDLEGVVCRQYFDGTHGRHGEKNRQFAAASAACLITSWMLIDDLVSLRLGYFVRVLG